MGVGLEIYNPDGSLQFSTENYRILTVLASITTNAVDGSASVPGLANREGLHVSYVFGYGYRPTISIVGTTVSWTYPSEGKSNNLLLILGY